ncbi:F-box protein At2g32560-like [Mercurialis annua]|uniref:F-box protein At2g32560-like n=1 Tax=Mercurialis annua TaxID=3986 RepID=UPI00216004C6|nr:F-box protein At2g32560-like [Mercurialis annua]
MNNFERFLNLDFKAKTKSQPKSCTHHHQMFLLLICWVSFILFFKSKSPPMKKPVFLEEISRFLVSWFDSDNKFDFSLYQVSIKRPAAKICFLDLPELAIDCILEKLSPSGLCSMGRVCVSLRERCSSDDLWNKHLKKKWGGLIGNSAFIKTRTSSLAANNSLMAMYMSLENGQFWFPAQVYNRENGHAGFLLSCHDAQLSYDSRTDTFQARYSPYGRRMTEDGIEWHRLRAAPVDTPAYHLHISDCLHHLKPGDHIEIQWRRSTEFPYGWWFAVVGHVESCDGNENSCHCQYSDKIVMEFNQYSPASRWRRIIVNRKDHKEEGNEADGFYGGIRKLYNPHEISIWKNLWPTQVFE